MTKSPSILPYIDSRLEIRWIPEIEGRGVFTKKDIKAGEIIEIAPLIIFPRKIMEMSIWLLQAEGVASKDFVLDQYGLTWSNDMTAIPLGWAAVYNHRDTNNCRFMAYEEEKLLGVKALQDIQANEQCCVSYGPDWFREKGWITKIEF